MKESIFSRRTNWTLNQNEIVSLFEEFREQKISVVDLTESNPTKCGFSYLNKGFLNALPHEASLSYEPHSQGMLAARKAICDYYKKRNLSVRPEQIFLCAGTSEAYTNIFRLLANYHEKVLFSKPSYPLFQFLADLNDVELDSYNLIYADHWQIDWPSLEKVATPLTKAIVVVNPNNPTGSFIKKDELARLNKICHEKNLALISDEVFVDFVLDNHAQRVSLVNNKEVLTFVLGGISKTLGLPQMKLAWIVLSGPEDLVKEASSRLEIIADTYLSVNTPVQNALPMWLSQCEQIQAEIISRLKNNLNILKKEIHGSTCRLLSTEGGWYAILRLPDTMTEDEWVINFLKKDHVFVHPGYFFDFDNGTHIILSLLPESKIFEEGIKKILQRLTLLV